MKKKWKSIAAELVALLVSAIFVVPIWMIFVNSLKDSKHANQLSLSLAGVNLKQAAQNYAEVFRVSGLTTAYLNSTIITVLSVALIVLTASMAAFIIQRRKQKWVGRVNSLIILGMTMPGFTVPTYFLLRSLGLLHTYLGICLVYTASFFPLAVFIFTGYFRSIPDELDESALLDGCTPMQMYWKIILPLIKPVMVTVIIIAGMSICHIERVAAVTGGVILRNVQFGEVIVGKFNLGAVKNFEAHGDKNILGLIERFVHRVAVAQLNRSSGDGHVDCLGLQSGFHGLFLEFGTDGLDFFLNGSADIVRSLSHNGTFLCRQLAHCLQNTGQFAFFAEKAHAQRVQFSGVLDALERAERFLPDLFELFLHKRILLFVIIQKNKPFARDRDERPCFRGTTRCSQKKSALLFMPDNGGNNRRVLVGK